VNRHPKGERLPLEEARRRLVEIAGPALDAEMRGNHCCAVLNVKLALRPVVVFNRCWSQVFESVRSWLRLVDEWTIPGPEMYDEAARRAVDLNYNAAHQHRMELPTLRVRPIHDTAPEPEGEGS
jgi:hypothetical protein